MSWLDKPLGRAVMAREEEALARALGGRPPFPDALCVAPQSYGPIFSLLAQHCHRLHVLAPAAGNALEGEPGTTSRPRRLAWGLPESLPYHSRQLDLVVLIHCLEFSRSPYAILAETERVLAPNGQLLALVFNPYSWFGLARLARRGKGQGPWSGWFQSRGNIRRMAESTGLVFEGGHYCFWHPPIDHEGLLQGLRFLEPLSRVSRLPLGGIGCYQARKEEPGMTLLGPAFRAELNRVPGRRAAASPLGRVA